MVFLYSYALFTNFERLSICYFNFFGKSILLSALSRSGEYDRFYELYIELWLTILFEAPGRVLLVSYFQFENNTERTEVISRHFDKKIMLCAEVHHGFANQDLYLEE